LQIPRHTRLAPGQFPVLTGQITGQLAALVTKPTSTAVPLAGILFAQDIINHYNTKFSKALF